MVKRGGKPLPRRCRSCSWARLVALNPPSHPYPRDDVDDVMVRRLMFGERDGLGSIADRLEATRRLTRDGHSAAEIALLMGVTRKSVERYRKELRNTGRLSHVAVYCDTEGVAA